MVFQQKLVEKSIFHCQNDWSGYGPADQFCLLESALRESVHFLFQNHYSDRTLKITSVHSSCFRCNRLLLFD